jgi:hypothetical protein
MQHPITPPLASRGRAARNRRGVMRHGGGYREPHTHWLAALPVEVNLCEVRVAVPNPSLGLGVIKSRPRGTPLFVQSPHQLAVTQGRAVA